MPGSNSPRWCSTALAFRSLLTARRTEVLPLARLLPELGFLWSPGSEAGSWVESTQAGQGSSNAMGLVTRDHRLLGYAAWTVSGTAEHG